MANLSGIVSVFMTLISLLDGGEIGNSLVTCSACLSVQTQINDYSCKVNCHVIEAQNDGLVTSGIVQDLIEKLNQLNKTVQQQAQENEEQAKAIDKLRAPTELFSAHAYVSGSKYYSHSDGETFVFSVEIIDRLDSYDNVTGVFTAQNTGVYNLVMTMRSGYGTGQTDLYLKKPGEAERSLCFAKGNGGGRDSVCLLMQPLNVGDEVYVKFVGSGDVLLPKCYFQATFLYST